MRIQKQSAVITPINRITSKSEIGTKTSHQASGRLSSSATINALNLLT
ncbi:MAG: hypothetical protein ABI417_02620 [Coleofasciculaceae cyanobacterium]